MLMIWNNLELLKVSTVFPHIRREGIIFFQRLQLRISSERGHYSRACIILNSIDLVIKPHNPDIFIVKIWHGVIKIKQSA